MGTYYTEFDTTGQNLIYDLGNAILGSSDWSRINPTAALLTTSASVVAGGTTLTFTSTTGSGLAIGSIIAIDAPGSATREYRAVTAIAATTITVAALTYAHASGASVYLGNEVFKATTTRGADMVLDLTDTAPTTFNLNMAVYRSHTGTVGTDRNAKYLYWRPSAGALTNPLHVTVSVGKEHIFVGIEGPRANEAGAVSTAVGSPKSYFAMCDLVPYHAGDTTPVVFAGGYSTNAFAASTAGNNHSGQLSRNYANTGSWNPARLMTLDFPGTNSTTTVQPNRVAAGDGNFYVWPYVTCSDTDGPRGRLSSFFFAGFTSSTLVDGIGSPVLGQTISYGGANYKLIAVDKSNAASEVWGVFGAAANSTASTAYYSVVVAVPWAA